MSKRIETKRFGIVLAAVGLCGFSTCDSYVEVPSYGSEGEIIDSPWALDSSNGPESAYAITAEDIGNAADLDGTVFTEVIYPKFDDDYWKIEVTEPGQLIHVRVKYNKNTSAIRLAVDWIGPESLCVPKTPTSCSSATQCGQGLSFCDQERGGCRSPQAPPCANVNHCDGSQACAGAQDMIATVLESAGTMQHLITTNLPAHIPGDYYLRVYDRDNKTSDADTEYELIVGKLFDPDPNEPNNAVNMATPITNDALIEGHFSYPGDVDYYLVEPNVSSAAVVNVELKWATGSRIKPIWSLVQAGQEMISTKLPSINGTNNVHGAQFVMPSHEPILVKVENPEGNVDAEIGYELAIKVFADANEGSNRNDTASAATPLFADSFATIHSEQHTLIAENDRDWYRIERNESDNSLLNIQASANTGDFMLQVLLFETTGTCNPNAQEICNGGDLCICPESASCSNDQGVCIRPWIQRPVQNDPNYPPETGGRSPNNIHTQLPLFDATVFLQIAHLGQVYPPRQGYSTNDAYTLTVTHKQEPESHDRNASEDEFIEMPLGASASAFESHKRPRYMGNIGTTTTGYISYEGDQDWFEFSAAGIGEGQARVVFNSVGSGLDLRVRVYRGGSAVGDYVNGVGTALDPDSACYHWYSTSDTILVWINDNDFDDFDSHNAYSFTVTIDPGCNVGPCHLCRCQPDQGCGCGEPAPNECGVCDESIVNLGCGCGQPADQGCGCGQSADLGCGCGNDAPVDGDC